MLAPPRFPELSEPSDTAFAVVRAADLLVARIELRGLEAQGRPPELRSNGRGAIVVTLPPQHLAEQAFWELVEGFAHEEGGKSFDLRPPPVHAYLAGPTRLAFSVPEGEVIPFTLEGILDALNRLAPRLSDAASRMRFPKLTPLAASKVLLSTEIEAAHAPRPGLMSVLTGARRNALVLSGSQSVSLLQAMRDIELKLDDSSEPVPAMPAADETAIEAPFRLILSPTGGSLWSHATTPVASSTAAVELWTTRLQSSGGGGFAPSVRAVWTRDDINGEDATVDPGRPNPAGITGPDVDQPLELSLEPNDRKDIVHLSSNWKAARRPPAIDARALELSALGATLDLRGFWGERPTGTSVESLTHRAALGRDNYVRVVRAGYLMPFGNRAVCATITERKLVDVEGGRIAYLRKRMFIVVREPLKLLRRSGFRQGGTQFDLLSPLSAVRMVTIVTPTLDPPTIELIAGKGQRAFWPHRGGQPFRFAAIAIDVDGREIPFAMPLAFVAEDVEQQADFNGAAARYEAADVAWRTADLGGRAVAYAASAEPDDTSFDTEQVVFSVAVSEEGQGKAAHERREGADPRFVPRLVTARVRVPALAPLTDKAPPLDVAYDGGYVVDGLPAPDARAGAEVFLKLAEKQAIRFDEQADRVGALVTPNFEVTGLSRRLGPVGGDLAKLASGSVDPAFLKDLFEQLGAKLFGTINLWDILGSLGVEEALPRFVGQALDGVEHFVLSLDRLPGELQAAQVEAAALAHATEQMLTAVTNTLGGNTDEPLEERAAALASELEKAAATLGPEAAGVVGAAQRKLRQRITETQKAIEGAAIVQAVRALAGGAQLPKAIHTKLEWKPKLAKWPADGPVFIPNDERGLALVAEVTASPDGSAPPEAWVRCTLTNFTLDLVGNILSLLKLHFERFEFSVVPGQKPDVDLVLRDVEFSGPLSFVETLREAIPLDAFSDPPDLTVDETGVTASMSVGLPTLAVGVFSLQNLTIAAACHVPFVGRDPLSVRFDFSDEKSPAQLTVGPFGGGAYFGIEVSPSGIVGVRAAFEFGAGLAMSFGGVASGNVLVRAGVYFEMLEGNVTLTGYFRVRGELEVLGIISVCVELRLELTYKDPGKCYGRATLTIEIEIAWFSVSVELEAERTFAGGNADPTFLELMTDPEDGDFDPWAEYCGAFA